MDWSIYWYTSIDVYEKTTWYSIDCEENLSSNCPLCQWKCIEIDASGIDSLNSLDLMF
jgi:hypothetical protein